MQFWKRKRSLRMTARIRNWRGKDAKILGFAGYKAGMTHIHYTDTRSGSPTKGEEIVAPVTIIECPPMKIIAIKTLKKTYTGKQVSQVAMTDKLEKNLKRALRLPKQAKKVTLSADGIIEVRVLAQTQPHMIGLKKKPDILELGIGGKVEDQLKYAQEMLGKEIKQADVFTEGQQVDTHAVTKGKGLIGPVKRHGVKIRSHKAEKTKRGPATLGPWGPARTYRVAHAGQGGFQRRTEFNKWIMKLKVEPDTINSKAGFVRYGQTKMPCMLLHGSVIGPKKRLITMTSPSRARSNIPKQAPEISRISTTS